MLYFEDNKFALVQNLGTKLNYCYAIPDFTVDVTSLSSEDLLNRLTRLDEKTASSSHSESDEDSDMNLGDSFKGRASITISLNSAFEAVRSSQY